MDHRDKFEMMPENEHLKKVAPGFSVLKFTIVVKLKFSKMFMNPEILKNRLVQRNSKSVEKQLFHNGFKIAFRLFSRHGLRSVNIDFIAYDTFYRDVTSF